MDYLYCAYVSDDILRNLKEDTKPKFKITAIPIVGRWDTSAYGYIQLDGFYFVGQDHSTEYFTNNYLDQELVLNYGTAYYSTDVQKCIDFVRERYNRFQKLLNEYEVKLNDQRNAQISIEMNR